MNQILLIDDDTELCELLSEYLGQEGFDVDAVHDGRDAVERARAQTYQIIILDVMLPTQSGFDVLRALRTDDQTPVLMLTARGDDVDRIVGLELGADDYLPKPCNPRELVARVRAILRRTGIDANGSATPERLTVGDVELDPATRSTRCGGDVLELTSTEFGVLQCLLAHVGTVVTKESLSEQALGRKLGRYDRSIDMHVSNVRRKLGHSPDGQQRIKTVRGVGYIYLLPGDRSSHSRGEPA
jgi:DNA-binding response OmpR family regulator